MSFYRGRYAELYDVFYRDKPYAEEAKFVYDSLTLFSGAPPKRILELACGTGNHAIELAQLGTSVVATDISVDLLNVARRKPCVASLDVSFEVCDMVAIPVPSRPFDAVICMFDSIGYVQSDENLRNVFEGVYRVLKPGGLFLFEFWHAAAMRQKYESQRFRRIDTGNSVVLRISETSLDRERCLARVKYDLFELNHDRTYEHISETQVNRYFTAPEIEGFATIANFVPLAAYAGFNKSAAITDDTWHVISVCQRPA